MAFRTTCKLVIQSTTQAAPLVGSWVTAGNLSSPTTQPYTVTLGAMAAGSGWPDAAGIFVVGDMIQMWCPYLNNAEPMRVSAIPSPNQLTFGPGTGAGVSTYSNATLQNPVAVNSHVNGGFGVGAWVSLLLDCNSIYVQPEDDNTGQWLYIGNSPSMTATYRRIKKLTKVASNAQPNDWTTPAVIGNPYRVSELWILGTAIGDGYTVTLGVE
jgi:hypothetical protein